MKADTAGRIKVLLEAARAQKLAVGGSRGTTGPLGELYACELLHLDRAVDGMRGYDATDAEGHMVQIKSRAPEKGEHVDPMGSVGRIVSWDFDYAVLVLLDGAFRVDAIWRAEQQVLTALQAKVRNPAHGIPVHEFLRVAHRVDATGEQPSAVDHEKGRVAVASTVPARSRRRSTKPMSSAGCPEVDRRLAGFLESIREARPLRAAHRLHAREGAGAEQELAAVE